MEELSYIKARNLVKLEMAETILRAGEKFLLYILQDVVPGNEKGIQKTDYLSLISNIHSLVEQLSNIVKSFDQANLGN